MKRNRLPEGARPLGESSMFYLDGSNGRAIYEVISVESSLEGRRFTYGLRKTLPCVA